eukprot:COSAG05_NODE_17491_length_324_cov_0.933333_1_plen_106_part_01
MPKARVTRSAARLEEQDPPPPEGEDEPEGPEGFSTPALPLRLVQECSVELASLASLPGLRRAVLVEKREMSILRVQQARDDLAVAFGYADFGRSQSQAGFNVGDVA